MFYSPELENEKFLLMTQFSLCQIFKFAFSCAFPPNIPFSRPEWDSTYLEPLLALILFLFLCVITTWPAILKRAVQNFAGRVRFPYVNLAMDCGFVQVSQTIHHAVNTVFR